MKLTVTAIHRILVTTGLLLGLATSPLQAAELKEGKDYTVLAQPQPTDVRGKVEVTEFFWYGCPHCYEFEPTLNSWVKTLPKDVAFRRVPADFGRWTGGAKLYYALEALGEEGRLHKELFDAIHGNERLNFNNEAAVADWLVKKGIDRKKFSDAYSSFSVQSSVNRAQQLTRNHALTGVPTVIIGGKYATNNTLTGSFEVLPGILNQLVAKVRAEQGAAPAVVAPKVAETRPAHKVK
ncbi:MAG: thiol:disulfide interchange protein DsbA/DsbL [Sterolibacterium sp.]|jgi:thiol:disulfide interchange protein DsbA|nr:thiol:disulfide interchange protein DsbA/DsbL [Sterolibacterium sp.]